MKVHTVASLPALVPWAPPPAQRGPSLESIYRVSITVDLCEGNKIISFKKFISAQPVGGPSKRKKNLWALGTCPVCPLVKTALGTHWRQMVNTFEKSVRSCNADLCHITPTVCLSLKL